MHKLVTVLALSAALGACATPARPPPTPGAAAPAPVAQTSASSDKVAISTASVAGVIGTQSAQTMDRADQVAASRTRQTALETGQPNQPLPWRNPDSGHSGTVVPGLYYQDADNHYCRDFQQTINVGGATQQGQGKACRQPDGTWKVLAN
jgi:surface antigen